ncbi:damaged DNA binding [Micractinium conductrix]|uniref:Damaged DNA binding n=1 Tax=Micractinium conductrix TaxID=554055 RepID=A0A2P6VRZ4_9CHLO|nr:damaged DNA binding [Micractinium conductrix]|eukprot:PSC76868.1 damaged DNA binding [Micractinium conductrix]
MEVQATIASVRGLVQALQAIRTSLKLPCAVTFDASGLKLRFLDGGHTMQSGISLSAAVFSQLSAPTSLTFCAPLNAVLDSINTVASSMPQELHMQYPGPDNCLLITANEDPTARTHICSYAKVATLAQQGLAGPLDEMWDPAVECSHAILSGLMLREAIEDLEWTGGAVEFAMHRSPTRFSLRSAKQTSLEITFPSSALNGFHCHAEEVRARYKYKHLKAAFANVAQKDSWMAKVSINAQGVLLVMHMLTLAGSAAPPVEAPGLLGTFTSQSSAQRGPECVVKFVILPHDEAAEAYGEDEDQM